MNEIIRNNGEVSAALLKGPDGYTWAVVYVNPNGATVIVGDGYANVDAARSAAWQYAKDHGATFVSSKLKGARP